MLSLARKWVQRHGAIVLTFHRVLTDSELQQTASLGGMIVRNQYVRRVSELRVAALRICQFGRRSQSGSPQASSSWLLPLTMDGLTTLSPFTQLPLSIMFRLSFSLCRKELVPRFHSGRSAPPRRLIASPQLMVLRRAASIGRAIEELKALPATERESRISQMIGSGGALESSAAVDKTMTWGQIAELHAHGVTFGSHTSTHEILTMVPAAQAEQEIVSSREAIQQKLGGSCHLFSYPNGDCSEQVRELVEQAGYKFAFLNQEPGVWTRDCDPFLIPRVNVCEYHLVDSKGDFSPLIFDYAVVWNAAKGLLSQMLSNRLNKFQKGRQISGQGVEANREEANRKVVLRTRLAERSNLLLSLLISLRQQIAINT